MTQIPENVRTVLVQLIPASVINDIVCFVFYDNHPRDNKNIDITVYTKMGEVREYYQRDLLSSVNLECMLEPSEIRILRNSQCELFYLVAAGNDLTILSRKDKLQIHHRLTDVYKYEISDSATSGQAVLKVVLKSSGLPLVPDDNFENFKCQDFAPSLIPMEDETKSPIITHLKRKLTEAKYSVRCNEKTLKEFLDLRQSVVYSMYKKIHPNLDDSIFKDHKKMVASVLKIHTQKPWIKTCNKKLVIVYTVSNGNDEPLKDVNIHIHGTTKHSIEYITKIFERTDVAPFWIPTKSQTINPHKDTALAVVIDLDEIVENTVSKIEFNGVIIYKKSEKECVLPLEDVYVSSLDTMGEQFDVLCSNPMDANIMLAVLATTEKTDLILRHIKSNIEESDPCMLTAEMFCKYLQMEIVPRTDNIVIHRKSPYHVLNGVMIVLNTDRQGTRDRLAVTVHSRSPTQVLALIHHIHDAVPYKIVTTTPTHKITAKNRTLLIDSESDLSDNNPNYNYVNYATSMLNRTGLVIEYLDNCMIQMNESKNSVVRNKVGSEIDIFALGVAGYNEFKEKMREQAAVGIKMLNDKLVSVPVSDEMCID